MASKSNYQSFQTSWAKTLNWANSQGIPRSSVYPVYQLDSQRILSGGYQLSEAERTRAILASYNPNNVTPLPTDKPAGGIGGFFSNIEHDATNIFTGLQPIHLVDSIYQSVKNTVEHPGWLLDPTKNTLAQLIPGVSLIGEYEQGGLDNVLAHPLISALNVLGVASAGVGAIAHTAMGDVLAESLGLQGGRAAIGVKAGMGPLGIARKAIGNIGTKEIGFGKDVTGAPTLGPLTVSQKVKNWTNVKGMGGDVADIAQEVHGTSQAASARFKDLVVDFTKANAKLQGQSLDITDTHLADLFSAPQGSSPSYSKAAYNLVTMSGKSFGELRMNDAVPVAIKEILPHYEQAQIWLEETALASGELVKIRLPDGTYGSYSANEVKPIIAARDKVEAADARVAKLSRRADQLTQEINQNDNIAKPAFEALSQIGGQVRVAIKGTLMEPGVSGELASRLRSTLPASEQWERLNVNQAKVAQLLGVSKVTLTQARLVNEIFGTGGLIDQIAAAYGKEDFAAFRDLSLKLVKRLRNKQLSGTEMRDPLNMGMAGQKVVTSPALEQVRTIADNLYTYGKARQKAEVELSRQLGGKYATHKGRDNSLHAAVLRHQKLQADFEKVVWRHPAAVWQPLMVQLVNTKIAETEQGALAVDKALAGFKSSKAMDDKTLAEMRKDPTTVIALLRTYMDASLTAPFGATLDRSLVEEMKAAAHDDIAHLRAEGFEPHYVPNFSSRHDLGGYDPGEGTYNVYINPTRQMTPDAAKERLLDQSNTIYDIHAGMTRAMKQRLQSDATQHVIDDYLIPKFGYKQSDLVDLIARENPTLGIQTGAGTPQAYLAHILETTYEMDRFDPASFAMSSSRHITGGETIWMPKTILQGLTDIVNKGQLETTGAVAGATRVFRTSVLGYSPRFIAHILFGGSFLVALREPASFLRLPEAVKMLRDPEFRAAIHTRSTQVGADNPVSYGVMEFHREGGKAMGRLWAQEMMDKLGLPPDKMTSWLKVIPQMTFKLTNTITDMQRASVVLSGIHAAERRGKFLDRATGKMMDMTQERAIEEGIRAANKVMGDLSHMTPLERNVITTVIPFYGWTKHILQYVATYPVDHPYRAVFLAYLANMNSDEVSKALYKRLLFMFFLGSPDAQGNVSGIDVRFADPLRDVANYATIGGLISMLNPVISAPMAMVDPEIVFGSNVLYPTITYNQLYGTKTAAPAGSGLTVAEQFIPELTSIDAALGLSSQYRNLAKSNPNSFAKAIFGALNIPFAQVQHLNLKQIAAQQEIDRYQQANQAAQAAFQSGGSGGPTGIMSALAGYGDVPDPLQTDYNISPAQLQSIYNQTLSQTGLPPSEVLPSLPAPANL